MKGPTTPNGPISGPDQPQSIVFTGTGNAAYDRLTTPVNGGEAANIGGGDFTWRGWLKPSSANNNTGSTFADANIWADRDNFISATGGEYIFSILNNSLHVSVSPGTASGAYDEFEGTSSINDGAWHFIEIGYDFSTGNVYGYVDGTREINATASNSGTLAWVSGGSGGDIILELGGEKHEQGADLAYTGSISDTMLHNAVLNTGTTAAVPTSRMAVVGSTIVHWPFDEGSGTTVDDVVGDSPLAVILNGGSPPPIWSTDSPYA